MKLKILAGMCMLIAILTAINVSAYLDCTPSACPSVYTDNGINCSSNKCVRDCTVNVCSGSWTQVFSNSCGWISYDLAENECSTASYNSSATSYCYKFSYDGPGSTVMMDVPPAEYGTPDNDSEAIGGFFDNAKNTPNAWFENLTSYLGDVAYTSMDYLWQGSRAHAQAGSDSQYVSDISVDGSIFCAPNSIACNQVGAVSINCSVNCYNHKTFAYAYQGYVRDYTPTYDDTSTNNDNLYRNDRASNSMVSANKLQDTYIYVYQSNLAIQHFDQTCYRANEAPTASNVLVLPANPDAGDNLFCNYTYSDPENFTELNSFYEWWKNSVNQSINSQVLLKGNLTPNDVWYCKVMPSDGLANGTKVQSSNNVTISGTVKEPAVYVNGSLVWSSANYYSDSEWVANFDQQLVNSLANCTPDAEGYCNLNLSVYSGASGVINVSSVEIYYELPPPTVISLKIQNLSQIYSNITHKVFEFVIENNGTSVVNDVVWNLSFGDGAVINSSINGSLEAGKTMLVFAEHNYSSQGQYNVTAEAWGSGGTVGSLSAVSEVGYLFVSNFSVLNSSASVRKFEAYVRNKLNVTMANVSWSLNTGNGVVSSTSPITLQPQEVALVFVAYNYTSAGAFTANFTAVNGSWSDLEAVNVTIT